MFNRKTGKPYVKESSAGLEQWREDIGIGGMQARQGPALAGPVRVEVTFCFARPANQHVGRRVGGELREDAPPYPANRSVGDIDKLLRAVLDGLTGPVLEDDSQVVSVAATRLYGTPESAEIVVSEMRWEIE
jgi:Holliday junction resolvase RusA-like endonuclease